MISENRYSRQVKVKVIGEEGQEKLSTSVVSVVGCGALGSVLATLCVRSGIGEVRLFDRDVVEIHNLQRQILYTEEDAREGIPKAVAARRHLGKVNSEVKIEAAVVDLSSQNISRLLEESNLILDGTDNFLTRFLINDVSHKMQIPWIYAGVVSTYGHCMAVLPGKTPCLQCYLPDPPAPGEIDTCDIVGVLGSSVMTIASQAFNQGMKILLGQSPSSGLFVTETWEPHIRCLEVEKLDDCPCCRKGEYSYLNQSLQARGEAKTLCGSNAVQIRCGEIDLPPLAKRLQNLGEVKMNPYALKFTRDDKSLTLFQDGRAIVTGTSDPAQARSFFARYVGI